MKSLKKKRRIQVILLTFVALVISTGMIGYAMRDGINFFRSPSQGWRRCLPRRPRCFASAEW